MKLPGLIATAITLVAAGGTARVEQSGVPCYYDWTQAPRQHFMIADSPEYKSIVDACRRNRADSVPWDEHVRKFQAAADMRALAGEPQTNLVRLVEMVRKERDHLRASASRPAPAPLAPPSSAPIPSDTDVRTLSIDSIFERAPASEGRYTVEPHFRAWVPKWLQEQAKETLTEPMRILGVTGNVTIRRGTKTVALADVLRAGQDLVLRPGDIFETGADGSLELEADGRYVAIRPNSSLGIGMRGSCLQKVTAGGRRSHGWFLIEGMMQWATTTEAVKGQCAFATASMIASIRGTEFIATNLPNESEHTLVVTVRSGSVEISEDGTGKSWTLGAGETKTLTTDAPPPPLRHEWSVQNTCNQTVRFTLYEVDAQSRRVASWPFNPIPAGETRRLAARDLIQGNRVCYGAVTASGDLAWGAGADGNEACDRCCWKTTADGEKRTVNLSCR